MAQSLVFCVMVGRLLVGFVWLNLQFSVSWQVDIQWGSCGSIFSLLCHDRQTFSGFRVGQSLDFCVMVGRLLVGFVWLNRQFSVSWQVDIQWGSCGSIFCFLRHGWQTCSGVREAQSLVFCVMVCRLLVEFVWLYLQFSVSWQVDIQWGSCGSIFRLLCHDRQTFSGFRVAQSLDLCVMVGRLLVGFVWLKLQFSVSWQVDIQWGSCGSIFCFLLHGWQTCSGVREAQSLVFFVKVGNLQWGSCGSIFSFLSHGWQTFSGVRVAQSLVFCVIVRILLVGFVCLNLQFSASWLGDFQWGSCGSNFSFLSHGRQTFSGVRVAQSLLFCLMVGRILVGFVWLNLLFSVSWLVDFQWASCVSIFRFLCHGWNTFSGVRVAQSLVFCVMVGRLLVGFVWLNLQFSVAWLVDFQWGSCVSIFSFLCHGWQTFSGVRWALQTFNGFRVSQSLVFCVMVGRLLVGFVWLNLLFSVSCLVDFQWGSCGGIVSFLCHGRQIFSGVRVAQSSFLCHGWQTFSGVRVAQSLGFCVMVGRPLAGLVWLNLQFYVSWLIDFQWGSCGSIFSFVSWQVDIQWGSCGSIFSFLCHVWQTFSGVRVALQTFNGVRVSQSLVFCVMVGRLLVGFVWLNRQFSVSWQVDIQWGSCGSIFCFLRHGWQTCSGVREAQSLVFCVMVCRLLVEFVWLYLQFSVSWQVDIQWGSCGSIFRLLCHDRQTFSGFRVAQSLDLCVMVGRLLVGFVWLKLQFSVSWQVDIQWGSCGSIFCFLLHGWQTCSGVREAQSLVFFVKVGNLQWGSCGSIFSFLSHGWQTFSGVRVAQSLVFCVIVRILLVGFVCLNLQFSASWLGDFQWGSCGSNFSFLSHGRQTFSGVRVAQYLLFCLMVGRILVGFVWLNLLFSVSWLVDFQWASCVSIFRFLCHGWNTFSGVRVAQSLVFCVMVGRLLVGFVWLNLQFSVAWLVDFQWGSCVSIFSFLCHGWQTFSGVRWALQTFNGVRVSQSLVFCVMVGRLLVGFVWLNLLFSVSCLVDFQWGSCGGIVSFLCHGRQIFSGVRVAQSSFLCHGWQTFSGVRVAQSLGFCVMVGRPLAGLVWLNLQFYVSWLIDFQWGSCGSIFSFVSWQVDIQWGSCGSIFSFLCHVWQTFSGVRVALQTFNGVRVSQSLVFCVMVGRLLVEFVWLYLQFSVSWLIDLQWGSCGSMFTFLCHVRQTFSGFRVSQSLVFCVMVGRLLVGFVWLNLQFSVSWQVDIQWGSCGSIFSILCHDRQTLSGFRVAQSLDFCVMVGRLLVGFVWLKLQFSVSWQVDIQWGSCGSIFCFLSHGWQTCSGVREAQSLVFCVKVGNLQWGSCSSIFSFLSHGWQTFSGVRVAQSLVFCVMVRILLVGFVCLNLQFSASWLGDFQWGSCGSNFSYLGQGWRISVGFVWLNLYFSVSWLVDFQWASCVSIFSFPCHGWQTFSGLRVSQYLDFCVMVGRLVVGFVRLNLQFSVLRLATLSGVRVAQSLVFCLMVGRLLVGFVWLNLQFSASWFAYFQWGSCVSIFSFLRHGWETFSGVRVAQTLVF